MMIHTYRKAEWWFGDRNKIMPDKLRMLVHERSSPLCRKIGYLKDTAVGIFHWDGVRCMSPLTAEGDAR